MNAVFTDIAASNGLKTAGKSAYGLLGGCFVTLAETAEDRSISIYVGPQGQPAPGYPMSRTMSCADQICHTIFAANGQDNRYGLLMQENGIPTLILKLNGSIVKAVFSAAPEADEGVGLFVTELLPQIAALTQPNVCFCCGQETRGEGCPVVLADEESVAPLHIPCFKEYAGIRPPTKEEQAQQNRAVLFAAAGALIGAVVWALLYGNFPIIIGVLMGLLPVLAYDWQKGVFGPKRILTVAVCAVCAVLLGSFGATMLDLMDAYKLNLTAFTAKDVGFWGYVPAGLTQDPAISGALVKSLIAGVIVAGIGCLALLRKPANVPFERPVNAYPLRLKGKC